MYFYVFLKTDFMGSYNFEPKHSDVSFTVIITFNKLLILSQREKAYSFVIEI